MKTRRSDPAGFFIRTIPGSDAPDKGAAAAGAGREGAV